MSEEYIKYISKHNEKPNNFGKLKEYTHKLEVSHSICGGITLFMQIEDTRIEAISFTTVKYCDLCKATASVFTEILKGKQVKTGLYLLGRFKDLKGMKEIAENVKDYQKKCMMMPLEAMRLILEGADV